jgi:hypothetical protein
MAITVGPQLTSTALRAMSEAHFRSLVPTPPELHRTFVLSQTTLQHHYQEQDKILESLDQVIERQHANALEISRELMTHQKLLIEVELDVDQANGRLKKRQ